MSEKTITIGLTNKEFNEIQDMAATENMSVSMYCKSILFSKSDFTVYYNHLINKVNEYPANVKFTIRDVIGDEMWDNIPIGTKLALGRQFYSQVHIGRIYDINIEGYGAAKTMRYSKKGDI